MKYLPVSLSLILLELGLVIFALTHPIRHPQVRIGNKWIRISVTLPLRFLGSILYIVIGREEQQQWMY